MRKMTGTYIWLFSILAFVLALLYKSEVFDNKGLKMAIPQLPYLNKKETIAFYQDILKFEIVSEYDGYIITKKDKIEIHLWKTENPIIPTNTGCYIRVNKSIDLLYKEYESKGIMHEHGKLDVKPWGMKQFSIRDNSGNIIHFGQNAY